MIQALAIARRELVAFFHAPIAYVVAVLFLALQGFSFWAVVEVLADPARPAGYGAVLRTHFGGTFLYWAILFALVSVLAMRLIAEERRAGTLEALLTTPVGEAEVVVGKWLGALAFYLLLWLPTLAYPIVLAIYAPPGTTIDAGPIAAAYLGVLLSGAGFLALGLAASALSDSQVVAAVTSFAVLLGLLLVGQLGEVTRDAGATKTALIDHLDLRGHMDNMARGAINLESIALWVGLVALGLAAAVVLCARGRGDLAAARRRLVALGLVAANVVLVNLIAARRPVRWDVSSSGANQLDPRTRAVLAEVEQSVEVTVVRPEVEEFAPVYVEVDRLLGEMARVQPLLRRRSLDPTREPERLRLLAGELALAPRDLADAGAVLFEMSGRRRGVDLLDLASFEKDALEQGAMARFRAEEAFARALVELALPARLRACATSGHGEMPLGSVDRSDRADWSQVAARLRRLGMAVEDVGDVRAGVPDRCDVLLIAGPEVPLGPDAALAVGRYLSAGGRLLLAALDTPIERDGERALPATGLELVLDDYGISLPPAVVVDPHGAIEVPLAWATATGYGNHPITSAYRNRRFTVWQHPRVVLAPEEPPPSGSASEPGSGSASAPELRTAALVQGSPLAWAETDVGALFAGLDVAAGTADLIGPATVAVAVEAPATGARLVVLGSATSPSSRVAGRGLGAADALVATSAAWLAGQAAVLEIASRTPEHVRLVMAARDRRAVFALTVVILPLLTALAGALFWWRRRRG